MATSIKLSECIPFPTGQGHHIRLVIVDSPEKKGAVIIMQGHILLFNGDEVTAMHDGSTIPVDQLFKGDQKCESEGMRVFYAPIVGVNVPSKSNPQANGVDKLPRLDGSSNG